MILFWVFIFAEAIPFVVCESFNKRGKGKTVVENLLAAAGSTNDSRRSTDLGTARGKDKVKR